MSSSPAGSRPVPSDLAGPPPEMMPVPAAVRRALAARGLGDARLRPVWRNGVGGLTFAVGGGSRGPLDRDRPAAKFFAKWNPAGSGESLFAEAKRLRWLRGRHSAPTVVELIADGGEEVMLTRALPGASAVAERWKREPETALRALGTGLRRLHAIPVENCPFDWSVEHRIATARVDPDALGPVPPVDRLVVCQGDPCAPNTLIADDGSFLAHVDLGRLGIADRWADLAAMTMSLEWNYSSYDEAVFWEAYGVAPDPVRIDFYRRLWNAE